MAQRAVRPSQPGYRPDEELRTELIALSRRKLAALAPKEIEFDQDLL
jgi:acetyl-CoA synthetase